MRFTGDDGDIDLEHSDHPEFNDWKWVEIDALPDLIVAFKRPIYRTLVDRFRPLATPLRRDTDA
jgi:putative (di)nucleoside polyphosphate hydrolase